MSSVLEEMRAVLEGDDLYHYGTKRHSGRYPYGSGDDPYQHGGDFLTRVEKLRSEGINIIFIDIYRTTVLMRSVFLSTIIQNL